ncbi:type II toxin-antitoxin system RelE/ParE family toxin [Oceanisphaera sp. IT1-181]|uniref:type II toxin-antitoxin system RelE/ParE family toxin n=1 Tax=Oceanisphaera sp. IT1-181 TaxID=3081199 RepID=UPI0029CA9849|nr:type II toxin-antitoxin system RelE/ParE family toxin [Oceanisphaera sp. IT1-181]
MSAEQNEIDVYQTNLFSKQIGKLSDSQAKVVEDEIDKVVANPSMGEQKVGDLSHLWVHKFKVGESLVLLGYSWIEDKLELYLLNIGSHENFYQEVKNRRKADLKFMK